MFDELLFVIARGTLGVVSITGNLRSWTISPWPRQVVAMLRQDTAEVWSYPQIKIALVRTCMRAAADSPTAQPYQSGMSEQPQTLELLVAWPILELKYPYNHPTMPLLSSCIYTIGSDFLKKRPLISIGTLGPQTRCDALQDTCFFRVYVRHIKVYRWKQKSSSNNTKEKRQRGAIYKL
ncbi:hypothetical protein BDN67DRAFT_753156 [Paxillus ammoniavirescens]|nr:hypothetical protein BDN67DRAFT_753156 [Paxillus ammoniavirescens]